MSKFTEAEDWCKADYRKRNFTSTATLPWEVGCKGSGLWVTVPVGFTFDMSVPKALCWAIDPMNPRFRKAAALHDFAFVSGWDRVSAAAVFSEALRATGVGRAKRLLLVCAVIIWNWT